MRLSTKGRYAVTAMLDLAMHHHHNQGPITLAAISEEQGISLAYLEQLFARLRRAGLVNGVRGPGGGYSLSRQPEMISIADVITAIGEGIDTTLCQGEENCQEGERCLTHELWDKLGKEIFNFMDSITLAGFLESQQARQKDSQQSPPVSIEIQQKRLA